MIQGARMSEYWSTRERWLSYVQSRDLSTKQLMPVGEDK
jgi:hypothetical protein